MLLTQSSANEFTTFGSSALWGYLAHVFWFLSSFFSLILFLPFLYSSSLSSYFLGLSTFTLLLIFHFLFSLSIQISLLFLPLSPLPTVVSSVCLFTWGRNANFTLGHNLSRDVPERLEIDPPMGNIIQVTYHSSDIVATCCLGVMVCW